MSRQHPRASSKKKKAFRFAAELHERWAIGKDICDKGILLFLSVQEKAIGLSVGSGISVALDSKRTQDVLRRIRKKATMNDFGNAIFDGLTTIRKFLSKKSLVMPRKEMAVLSAWLAIFLIVLFAEGYNWRKRRRYRNAKKLLEDIDRYNEADCMVQTDYELRLRHVHDLFPDIISYDMMNSWCVERERNYFFQLASSDEFRKADPSISA